MSSSYSETLKDFISNLKKSGGGAVNPFLPILGGNTGLAIIPGRQYGKSAIAMRIAGASISNAMLEMSEEVLISPTLTLKDPKFPEIIIEVFEDEELATSPRNPNARAGRRKFWTIKICGRSLTQKHFTKTSALLLARTIYDDMVKKARRECEEILEKNPNYGRF